MKAKEIYLKHRNMLLNYVEQSNSPELKQFVDTLLTLERWKENRPKAKLTISIGKAEFENDTLVKFFPILSSRTSDPTVFVLAFKNEPIIAIQDRLYGNDTITSINLTAVKNLKTEVCETEKYKKLFTSFTYLHNDYNIHLTIYN